MLLFLLKNNEINRIKLLFLLNEKKAISFFEIQEQTNTSTTTANRLISEVAAEIVTITDSQDVVKANNQHYSWHNQSSLSKMEIIGRIVKEYFNNSIPYQVLYAIFHQKQVNILKLCIDINISQGYTYAIISDLNKQLQKYAIQIKKKNGRLFLEGEEANIFYLVYAFYNFEKRAKGEWQFLPSNRMHYLNYQKLGKKLQYNLCQQTSMQATFEACHFRQESLEKLAITNQDLFPIFRSLMVFNDVVVPDEAATHCEDCHLLANLFIRSIVAEVDTYEERVAIGKEMAQLVDTNTIIQSSCHLLDAFYHFYFGMPSCDNKDKLYFERLYLIILHTCYIEILGIDVNDELKTIEQSLSPNYGTVLTKNSFKNINKMVRKSSFFFKEWPKNKKRHYQNFLAKLLYSFSVSFPQKVIRIALELSGNVTAEHMIKKQITNHFLEGDIEFVDTFDNVDLLITDSYINVPKEINVHFIFDIFSDKQYKLLLSEISKVSYDKRLAYHKKRKQEEA